MRSLAFSIFAGEGKGLIEKGAIFDSVNKNLLQTRETSQLPKDHGKITPTVLAVSQMYT